MQEKMLKLVALSILFAIAVAAPPSTEDSRKTRQVLFPVASSAAIIQEPRLAKVGEYISSVPTSVSHQSSTIVHSRKNVVTPIVAPAVKTRVEPVISSYIAPSTYLRSAYAAYPYASYTPYSYSYQYPWSFYYGAPYTVDGYTHQQLYKTYI